MGIFDLFKKKEPAPAPITVRSELKVVEVEVKQRTPGEMSLADVGGYVSPSGGFVNFGRFRVSGVKAVPAGKIRSDTRCRTRPLPELRLWLTGWSSL